MAVDSAAKRASATLFLVPSYAVGVFPDGTIGQGDRQASAWNYSGILAGGAAPSTIITQTRSIARFVFARVFGRVN